MPGTGLEADLQAKPRGSRSAKLKRVIILPFFLVIAAGFALSWVLYVTSSREAVRDALAAVIRESSDRIAEELVARLDIAAHAAAANAAFLAEFPRDEETATRVRRAFLEQLRVEPTIAILSVGTEDGEYLEAQRLSPNEFRVGSAGVDTQRALVFRPVLPDGAFGEPNLTASDYDPRKRPWYRAAADRGGPAWSAPYTLYSNAEPVVAATTPIFAGGELRGVVSATITLGTLSGYLASFKEAGNGLMYVADAEGRLIAISTSRLQDTDGKRAFAADNPDPLVAKAAWGASSALSAPDPKAPGRFAFKQGGKRYLGRAAPFSPSEGSAWTIVLAVDESAYSKGLKAADAKSFVILFFFLGVSLLVGWLVVEYVTKPIRTMADGVDLLTPGRAIPPELSAFATRDNELGRLSRSFVAMKVRLDESFGAIEASLAEKDVLLKEVHHRVKNNLQIVSSILSIQSGTLIDPVARSAFDECQNRIQAMALVHEEVYRTGSFVELGMLGYFSRICETLRWGRDRGSCNVFIEAQVDEDAALPLDKAIPCGLVVNELVTNALKHAFLGRQRGAVTVAFCRRGPSWLLSVRDDGVGMPGAYSESAEADETASAANPSAGAAAVAGAARAVPGASAAAQSAVPAIGDAPDGGAALPREGIGSQLVEGLVLQLSGSLRYERPPNGGTAAVIEFPA
jgi:two-component sensor histidine kinase